VPGVNRQSVLQRGHCVRQPNLVAFCKIDWQSSYRELGERMDEEHVQLGVRVAPDALTKIDAAAERLNLSRAQVIEALARLCADRLVLAVDLPPDIPVPPQPRRKPGPKPGVDRKPPKKGR
jgi:hypothetical protein